MSVKPYKVVKYFLIVKFLQKAIFWLYVTRDAGLKAFFVKGILTNITIRLLLIFVRRFVLVLAS